jgi:iron complex transport system substrate-binding protein
VAYADTAETLDTYLASPAGQLLGQTGDGTVAKVIGTEFIAAVSPPTALSLTWGLDEYVALSSQAAKAAG